MKATAKQIIHNELSTIAKVTADEQWLEGERRGCFVPSHDKAVQARVFEIVFACGEEWRHIAEGE